MTNVVILDPGQWKVLSEAAHIVVFNERRDPDLDRIDFALIVDEDGEPLTYMTCRESDSETVYMNYGGAFPSSKGSTKSFVCYLRMLDVLRKKYLRGTTLIQNTNTAMLKYAMKAGLIITGMRVFEGEIFLENTIQFNK